MSDNKKASLEAFLLRLTTVRIDLEWLADEIVQRSIYINLRVML